MTCDQLDLMSIEELENLLDTVLPPEKLMRHYRIPIINTSGEIDLVNKSPNTKIELFVNESGCYTTWFYGQDNKNCFYIQTFSGPDQREDIYFLDKPINPDKVCNKKHKS
jgi:hypothetical protein